MNIEHLVFLLWFFGKAGRLKHKNHAQDCGKMIRHQRPAILPWFSSLKWRPSFRWYGRFTRYRPAAGLLLDTPRELFRVHALIRAQKNARVNFGSATNVVLFEQSFVTRLVLALDVIEQR